MAGRRKDANHNAIVAGLRAHGILVEEMPEPGDVLCYGRDDMRYGAWVYLPMEFKSDQKTRGWKPELTKTQARRDMPIPIVHTLAEALALFGRTP